MMSSERQLEDQLIEKLLDLKYEHRADIRDRAALEKNFREKLQALNHIKLTDADFQRLLDEVVTPDVSIASRTLRERNSFARDEGTPLKYTLVIVSDWCKNTGEVVGSLRISGDDSHPRCDVILLLNCVPVAHVELKAPATTPRLAKEKIFDYEPDPGNGYTRTQECIQ